MKRKKQSEFDLDLLRRYRRLPTRKKLLYLQKLQAFYRKRTPNQRDFNEKLKALGF